MGEPLDEEWKTFELYEKIRLRDRRKRFWVTSLTFFLFLALCSVPVVEEQLPKWRTLQHAQRLAVEIEKLKTLAIQRRQPIRMTFLDNGEMKIEQLKQCQDAPDSGVVLARKRWISDPTELKVMHKSEAMTFDLKLAFDQICFDPVFGLDQIKSRRVLVVAPVKDLTENRLDRASYVILDGESAKISIN